MKIRPSSNRTHQRLPVEGDRLHVSITTPLERRAVKRAPLTAQRRTRLNGAPVEQQESIAREKACGVRRRRRYSPTDHRQPPEVKKKNFSFWSPPRPAFASPRHPLPSSLRTRFAWVQTMEAGFRFATPPPRLLLQPQLCSWIRIKAIRLPLERLASHEANCTRRRSSGLKTKVDKDALSSGSGRVIRVFVTSLRKHQIQSSTIFSPTLLSLATAWVVTP